MQSMNERYKRVDGSRLRLMSLIGYGIQSLNRQVETGVTVSAIWYVLNVYTVETCMP